MRKWKRSPPARGQLVTPNASPREIECDHALAPFDRAATDAERKWGIDRLPSLVTPDMAAKWGRAMAKLNEAISAGDPEAIAIHAAAGIRGLAAMDAQAEASGATRTPDVWEYDDGNGFRFGIMHDNHQWQAAKEQRPDLALFTMREVSLALKGISANGLLGVVKERFPGAEVKAVRPREKTVSLPEGFFEGGGDEIPNL